MAGAARDMREHTPFARTVTAVLRHRWMMALKGALKDAAWSVKSRAIVNPPLPVGVRSVLFVCLGNICRSPFAEHVAVRRLAHAGGPQIRCASAGITARQSGEVPAHGRDVAMLDYGVRLDDDHQPQRLTREMVDAFDLVAVMEAPQLTLLRAAYPHAAHRIVLLSLLDPAPVSAHQRYHIDDPFAQPRAAFAASFARIDRAVAHLLEQIGPASPTT